VAIDKIEHTEITIISAVVLACRNLLDISVRRSTKETKPKDEYLGKTKK
jgi:hypothetical protein